MTAKVLPFRGAQKPGDARYLTSLEFDEADALVKRRGLFVALLVVRFVLVIIRPAAIAWVRTPRERRRIATRIDVQLGGIDRIVNMLVKGALR